MKLLNAYISNSYLWQAGARLSAFGGNGRMGKKLYDLRLFIKKMRCVFKVLIFNLIANKMAIERKKQDE